MADAAGYTLGAKVTVEVFANGDVVDVTGVSKGKGYQGVIKRYGKSRGPGSSWLRLPQRRWINGFRHNSRTYS